jgi:hypothetical protein
MEQLRRVPLPLVIAFALDVALAIVTFVAPELWSDRAIGQAMLAATVGTAALVPVGLILLARRTTGSVQRGAIVAACGAFAAVVLELASNVVRWPGSLEMISVIVSAAVAVGYAGMASRRAPVLAAVELAVVVGGHWLVQLAPHELYLARALATAVVELAIVALVSPPRPAAPLRSDRSRQLAMVAWILYAASLVVPAIRVKSIALVGASHDETWFGINCLMLGWLVLPGWLPNPLLGVGALLMVLKKPRAAVVLGCLAIIFAVVAVVILASGNFDLSGVLVGYWLWLASTVVFTMAAYLRVLDRSRAVT